MSVVASLVLAVSVASTGGLLHKSGGRIMPPGPGFGWGFPNGNPDGYGWTDYSTYVPLGADRTADYYFPRYYASQPAQMFFPTYYNPYVSRGQRYVAYSGCGGAHPFGGPPPAPADLPMHPYERTTTAGPVVRPPTFSGRVEAPPVPSGATGLIP